MKSIVWCVHPVELDISQALTWGNIQYINDRYIYGDQLKKNEGIPEGFLQRMNKAVEAFNPTSDYLLIIGDHVQLIAVTHLLTIKCQSFRILRYDRKSNGYFVVKIGE